MAILTSLRLLALGSLIATSIAKPVERRFEDGDDDDTPLPLVIWHGKLAPFCSRQN
jgi:palmitoyl-protein thioesterase